MDVMPILYLSFARAFYVWVMHIAQLQAWTYAYTLLMHG